jgi:hypothetical protein
VKIPGKGLHITAPPKLVPAKGQTSAPPKKATGFYLFGMLFTIKKELE